MLGLYDPEPSLNLSIGVLSLNLRRATGGVHDSVDQIQVALTRLWIAYLY